MTTTIEGLRLYQWGAEGTRSAGTLTMATIPTAAADIVTIGVTAYAFVVTASSMGDVEIGANVGEAQDNLLAAIAGTDGLNLAHPLVTAGSWATDDLVITARIPGVAGDLIATTENFAAGGDEFDAATLGTTTAGAALHGTTVDATSKIAIEDITWDDADENLYRPSYANGLLMRNRGTPVAVQHGTRFNFSDQPVVYEQLPHLLTMLVEGAPSTVLDVAQDPDVFVWTFVRNPTANPAPVSWTFEREFSDGTGNVVDQEMSYALLESMTFRWAQNEHLRMSGAGFARPFATDTVTAALSLPTAELAVSALSTVYLDSSWANLGNTQLAEQVVGWELQIGSGFFPLHTAEGRSDLGFTKHQVNGQESMLSLKMTVLLNTTTYAAELTAAAAGTLRAIRIRVDGSGGRQVWFDVLVQHSKPTLFKIGEQDGQDIVDLEFEEITDNTNFYRVIVEHPSLVGIA